MQYLSPRFSQRYQLLASMFSNALKISKLSPRQRDAVMREHYFYGDPGAPKWDDTTLAKAQLLLTSEVEMWHALPTAQLCVADRALAEQWVSAVRCGAHHRLPVTHMANDASVALPEVPSDFPLHIIWVEYDELHTLMAVGLGAVKLLTEHPRTGEILLSSIDNAELVTDEAIRILVSAVLSGIKVRKAVGTNERYALAKARAPMRRDFYLASGVRYERPYTPPQGGHHASPVAHERDAHLVCYIRESVEPTEVQELLQRGYVVLLGEDAPQAVLERAERQRKTLEPKKLIAYRWITRQGTIVNPDGPQAVRIQKISA